MTGQNVKSSMSDYSDGRIQIHKKSYPQSVMFIVFIKQYTIKPGCHLISILFYIL